MAKAKTDRPGNGPDTQDALLIDLAALALSVHFFDPDQEDLYKAKLPALRRDPAGYQVLTAMTFDPPIGECLLQIEALRTATAFRVVVRHASFGATIEGLWDFDQEELRKSKVVARTGSAKAIRSGVEALMAELEGADLDDEEYQDLMEALEDESENPRIGDDPKEPPPATPLDRNRVKAIARRLAGDRDADPGIEDTGWLEQMPQLLPTIADLLIFEVGATGKQRNEPLIEAYQDLLARQLEFVRYRQDAGWDWAIRMLVDYQQRLIALGEAGTIPRSDWFAMATALTDARVPISNAVQGALANAGFQPEEREPSQDMLETLRTFLDQLATMVSSAAEVSEAMKGSAAMMPMELRGFLATELALSPHAVLRDAVPLMLLDADSGVRRDAASALERSARPDTLSPDALRRTITIRNWLPPADRPALDSVIRKARLAGVVIGGWPAPSAALEFHATMIDGSGAQSLLAVDRSAKKGVFAGLLLRHGEGIVDAWAEPEMPRRQINGMLRDAQLEGVFIQVRKPFIDLMVQHAVGTAVQDGRAPPDDLLTIAELIGGADWKDRRLDIAVEAERLWLDLSAPDRSPDGVAAAFQRGLGWMAKDQILVSWFEDGPEVREALAPFARSDRAGMLNAVLRDILPGMRMRWAERFVLMAMWCEAAADAKFRSRARDLKPVAHALAGDAAMEDIPIMGVIAAQTVMAVLSGGW